MATAIKPFTVVVAATQRGGIGLNGTLPWPQLKNDMKHFKDITSTVVNKENGSAHKLNAVIMGRKTWDSLPPSYKPLPNRINVVLTRNTEALVQQISGKHSDVNTQNGNIHVTNGLDAALAMLSTGDLSSRTDSVHVIGGGDIYAHALRSPHCQTIHLTMVMNDFKYDVALPHIDRTVYELQNIGDLITENNVIYQYHTYTRAAPPHDEMQYLNLVREVIENGNVRSDRTGTGTHSLFGKTMRFDLTNGKFPLLTTKRVFWRGVVEELLWIVRGQTDGKLLAEKKVHIWDDNGSRDFLDKLGLTHREVGDLGPVYGFQWRFFGAEYKDCHTNYTGQGVDQLQRIIDLIRTNPTDRRLVLNAWNAADLTKMALPPCHVMCQFYISGDANDELSCVMYQRSADLGLGVPFNIASYSLLTYIIAHVTGKKPKEFIHVLGDAHVYNNHIEPLRQQIARTPSAFPTLQIKQKHDKVDDYQFDDFVLTGYTPQDTIKMQMAV